jgi:hypothetical protein
VANTWYLLALKYVHATNRVKQEWRNAHHHADGTRIPAGESGAGHAAIVGSYGWSSKAIEQISSLIPNLNVDVLGAFLHKGRPDEKAFAELDGLAASVADAHQADELVMME